MPRLPKSERIQLWLERLNRFAESQQTAAQFCHREQISLPSFYQWKRRLSPRVDRPRQTRNRRSNSKSARPETCSANGTEGFTELLVKPISSSAHARLPNGITIALGDHPEVAQLIVDRLLRHDGTVSSNQE